MDGEAAVRVLDKRERVRQGLHVDVIAAGERDDVGADVEAADADTTELLQETTTPR